MLIIFNFFTVLAELDELKKTSDGVRNTIRWLEREFTNGSRFIRLQRNNETKSIALIKVPKKLGNYYNSTMPEMTETSFHYL